MRTIPIFLALALIAVMVPTQGAIAQAHYRSAVDRQQKQAQAYQEQQNQRFKAIERGVDRLLQEVAGHGESRQITPGSTRLRQRP